jgi:hypothetical protein
MMHSKDFLLDAQSWTHLGEGARYQTKPPLLLAHCPENLAITLYPPPIVDMLAELNLFLSICFGQSSCAFNQLKTVWEEHQSPVSLATLAYEHEQFPPLSFCKALVTASFITLRLAKWFLAFYS